MLNCPHMLTADLFVLLTYSARMSSREGRTDDRGWGAGSLHQVQRDFPQSAHPARTGGSTQNLRWEQRLSTAIPFRENTMCILFLKLYEATRTCPWHISFYIITTQSLYSKVLRIRVNIMYVTTQLCSRSHSLHAGAECTCSFCCANMTKGSWFSIGKIFCI